MKKQDKKTEKTSSPSETIELYALRNTQLPEGEFVAAGSRIKVSPDYAARVLAEKNSPFQKSQK